MPGPTSLAACVPGSVGASDRTGGNEVEMPTKFLEQNALAKFLERNACNTMRFEMPGMN